MKNLNRKLTYLLAIFVGLIIITSQSKSFAQSTSVYVSPHPDDWQLFMNPNAYHSIKNSDEKVIFLHMTAGDGGQGSGYNNYYLAREEGSLRAIRFMSNTFLQTNGNGLGADMNQSTVEINGHPIQKFSYRNAVAYFLRIPDGDEENLGKLYDGVISSITAVEKSTTYNSLADLKETIKSIILLEAKSSEGIEFHVAETDVTINNGDHPTHYYSSHIMQDVASEFEKSIVHLYLEYTSNAKPQNVFDHDFLISIGTWGVTTSGISDMFHNSTWDDMHNSWLGRQYFSSKELSCNNGDPSSNLNLALSKPTLSSGNQGYHVSSLAVDGITTTDNWWGADPYPQWWQVDLQEIYSLNKLVVKTYYDGIRYYQYNIEVSVNGVNWTQIVDYTDNTTIATSEGDIFLIDNSEARYIRVNMNYNTANHAVHIIEFEAYGQPVSEHVILGVGNEEVFENKLDISNDYSLSVYPNPNGNTDVVKLLLDSPIDRHIEVHIYNTVGHKIITREFNLNAGRNEIEIFSSTLPKGILNVIVETKGRKKVKKIIQL